MNIRFLIIPLLVTTFAAHADSSTLDAAVGGGIGGAVGAAVGNEVGGREGAMIGGAIGAATGVAVNTDESAGRSEHHEKRYHDDHKGHFCPPGQAKKGNC